MFVRFAGLVLVTFLIFTSVGFAQLPPPVVLREPISGSHAEIVVTTASSGNPTATMQLEININGVASIHQLKSANGAGIAPSGHAFSWDIMHGDDLCKARYLHAVNGPDRVEIVRNGVVILTIP